MTDPEPDIHLAPSEPVEPDSDPEPIMPPKSDPFKFLDNLDRDSLDEQRKSLAAEYMKLNMSGADDAETKESIDKTGKMIAEIARRLKNMTVKSEPVVETTVVTQNYQPYSTDCAQFRALIDKVDKFESGREVAEFVSDIDNIHARIRVEIRDEKVVQHNFVSYVMGQMSTAYQQDLRAYEAKNPDTVWTWTSFRDYLSENYETSKSHFQIIQALFKMEKKPTESTVDYSGRVDHYLTRIKTVMRARYQAKKGKDYTESRDEAYDLIGAIAVLMKLEPDDNLMNFLSRDLDECFNGRDIAKHADRYLERRKVSDPVLSNPTVNYARNHSQKSGQNAPICKNFNRFGQCNFPDCRYRHVKYSSNKNYSNKGRGGRGASNSSRGASNSWRGKSGGSRGSSGDGRGGHRQANFVNQGNQADNNPDNEPYEITVESENHADFHNGSL